MGKWMDLNADAGESYGRGVIGKDEELFPYLSSVNLACGFHGGDPLTMARSVGLAKSNGVAVGAHPSFPDLVGFGRREIAASAEQVFADVTYQLGALSGFLRGLELRLHHVKAHGALYLRMMVDSEIAEAVARAVKAFDSTVPLLVLAGPGGALMTEAAARQGVKVVAEAYPDRAYLSDGQLAPRSMKGAVLDDPDLIAQRAVAISRGDRFAALDGGRVSVVAETLCIHGDNANAPASAAAVTRALEGAGVGVRAF